MSQSDTPLDYLEDHVLIAELFRRYDFAVFTGWKGMTEKDEMTTFMHSGGVAPCMGLMAYGMEYLRATVEDRARGGDDETEEDDV